MPLRDGETISPEMRDMLLSLSINEDDHMYSPHAARVLGKYGGEAMGVLRRIPSNYVRNNGSIWWAIHDYGPKMVNKVLDEKGLLEKGADVGLLPDYCRFWKDLKRLEGKGGRIIEYELIFFGEVQDVGFRGITKKYAKILGLTGYATNLSDGSVKCVVQGSEPRIEVLLKHLKKEFEISRIEKTRELSKTRYNRFDAR